ncbi:hypothetical protein [Paenibacillus sp. NAIST15-1]|uniref:hypothetical protein n=1 Tax=Paenibacillus sp. NAIST15-1 TaxID=1605994 RepID=UPI001D10F60B|nr:hypothetical protein [Paenibacillus sp. NAIST15-1]
MQRFRGSGSLNERTNEMALWSKAHVKVDRTLFRSSRVEPREYNSRPYVWHQA